MSYLKPGTLCVIVGGCPENIGLIVEVLAHIAPYLISGSSDRAITDRYKLRPLVDPKEESKIRETEVVDVRNRKRELADCPS